MPHEIADDEVLIRAILSPYHLTGAGKLKAAAFRPPASSDEVSVSRRTYVRCWLAKAYAKRWVANEDKVYKGLAFIDVSTVRKVGSKVADSRVEYLGHADISHGVVLPKGEPLPPQEKHLYDSRLKALADAARYVEDPYPTSRRWTGT